MAATGGLVINPHIPGSTQFDPLKELAPVAKLIDIPIVFVTNAKTGAENGQGADRKIEGKPGWLELRQHRASIPASISQWNCSRT